MPENTVPNPAWRRGTALVEQEIISSAAWLISIRWFAGLGVVAATWVATAIFSIDLPAAPLYTIGTGILVYNLAFRLAQGRLLREQPLRTEAFGHLTHLQILLDYIAMAALVHFSGGLESPAVLYYVFHVIIAATLLSARTTYLYATLAVVSVEATALLEYTGAIPHVHVPQFIGAEQYRMPEYILGQSLFLASTLYVTAFLGATLNKRLRRRAAEVMELSERLQRAYGRLQTLYENAQAANSTLQLSEVLERLVRATAEAMGVEACSIRLLDETGTRLRVAAVYGLSEHYVRKGELVLEKNPLAREVMAGRTVVTTDVRTDTRLQYPAEAIAEGIRSMLSAPLQGKGKPLGLMRAYSAEPDHFSQEDVAFLSALASQGSIAIENALAYQTLSKLDEAQSAFVLTITHELRAPVSVVRSLLRTTLAGYTGPLGEEQRDMLGRALRRADSLQALIDDLLDLAAGKSSLGQTEERVEVRLDVAVEQVLRQFQVPAQEKQVRLEWHCECGDRLISISATHEGIDRVLSNLVSNAVKYTPPGGCVQLTLLRSGGQAHLQIADTGIGIPEEALPHLFTEFYRAPNAKQVEKEGTGLGLAIAKNLVTRYDGRITVQSKVGQGTTFTLILPTVRD